MVNREYIKSQIDTLPDEILIGVDEYINKKIKQKKEIDKHNEEYLTMLDLSRRQIEEGKVITFTDEEFEIMTKMPPEEAIGFCEKIKARRKEK